VLENITDPKQVQGKPAWYRYYAGYSSDFVSDVIKQLPDECRLLDPWMGAGTTLSAAANAGVSATGVDLSPAMLVVARGRLSTAEVARHALRTAKAARFRSPAHTLMIADPLTHWFDSRTSAIIRGLSLWIDEQYSSGAPSPSQRADSLQTAGAFSYVALFTAVKRLTRDLASKNPSWTKRSALGSGQISVTRTRVLAEFIGAMEALVDFCVNQDLTSTAVTITSTVRANTRNLPFADNYFNAVVTSPPYCTRLDYVIAQSPELATLGLTDLELSELRGEMIGTPTMSAPKSTVRIGRPAEDFVGEVMTHGSYASASYYAPNFRQYFEGMAQSLRQMDRVTVPGASVVLVVQDSRFKDIYVDLAACISGMATDLGWGLVDRRDFTAVRSMSSVNQKTNNVTRTTMPIESVLAFSTKHRAP
jgi:hypothetical protein